ncbi:hypothetical protein [Myceligenerans cantabricum]
MTEPPCCEPGCDWVAELGEAFCVRHIGEDDWVERLRRTRVWIVAGRFAGRAGRLVGSGAEWATVDLGVPIDGGSGVVVVPSSAIQEDER